MHEQKIIDGILEKLDLNGCSVKIISLLASPDTLSERILKDIRNGIRSSEVLERSLSRIPLYELLDSIKIHTDGKTIPKVAAEIISAPVFPKS